MHLFRKLLESALLFSFITWLPGNFNHSSGSRTTCAQTTPSTCDQPKPRFRNPGGYIQWTVQPRQLKHLWPRQLKLFMSTFEPHFPTQISFLPVFLTEKYITVCPTTPPQTREQGWTKTQTIANHPFNIYLAGVLDSYSYPNNLQQTGGSKITKMYSLIVREARGLKSSCQQGHASFESSREPTVLVSSGFWWPRAFLDSEAWGSSASAFTGSFLCLWQGHRS